ncbi:MAG: hypothetical protein P9M14_08190 [Candidatus Alcyoniella australis]|nr:hypothetical protein [Candidatus Alcyoniella australis]
MNPGGDNPGKARWRLLLALLIAFLLAQNVLVLLSIDYPPASYPHFTHSAVLLKAYTLGEQLSADQVWSTNRRFNLMIGAAALIVRALGPSYLSVCLISSLGLIALLIGVYVLGSMLASERAGLAAAALLSSFPMVWGLSRLLEEQVPDAALAVWTVVCTLGLARRPGAAWAVPLCALLVLDYLWPKEITYLIIQLLFVGPAMVAALLFPAMRERPLRLRALAWTAAAALGAAVICLGSIQAELRDQLASLAGYYTNEAFANPEYEVTSLTAHPFYALLYYPYAMLVSHVGLWGLLCVAACAPWAFVRRAPGRRLLAIWLLVPWFVLLALSKKQDMYGIGFLPPLALLAAVGWERIPGGRWKAWLSAVALCALLLLGLQRTLEPGGGPSTIKRSMLPLNVDRYDWPIEAPRDGLLYQHVGQQIVQRARELYPDRDPLRIGLAKYPNYDFDPISYCVMVRDPRLRLVRMVNDIDVQLDIGRPVDLVLTFWPSDIQVAVGFWSREAYDEFPVPPELRPDGLARQLAQAGYQPAGRIGAIRFFAPRQSLEEP